MFQKKHQKLLSYFALIDFLIINVSLTSSAILFKQLLFEHEFIHFIPFAIQFNVFWFVISFWTNYYQTPLRPSKILYNSFNNFFYFITITLITYFAFKQLYISRGFYFSFIITTFVLVIMIRFMFIFFDQKAGLFKNEISRTILVLQNSLTDHLIENLTKPEAGYELMGYFSPNEIEKLGLTRLGNLSDMYKFAPSHDINHVFSTYIPTDPTETKDLITFWEKKGAHVHFIPDMMGYFNRPVRIASHGGIPIISINNEPLEFGLNRLKKRIFDIIFTLALFILILWWLIPLITALIIVTSGFPIFFIQERTGRDGKVFNCIKFRTMKRNDYANVVQASKNDDRVTFIGKFLRAYNLDELPQFWNVLMGDMSIVGPRPHMVKHTEEYRHIVDTYMVRLFLKPGITGLAQVNGLRGELNEEKLRKRVEKDIEYMNSWSLWLDVRIIIRTIWLTFRGDPHAY